MTIDETQPTFYFAQRFYLISKITQVEEKLPNLVTLKISSFRRNALPYPKAPKTVCQGVINKMIFLQMYNHFLTKSSFLFYHSAKLCEVNIIKPYYSRPLFCYYFSVKLTVNYIKRPKCPWESLVSKTTV